MGLDTTHDCWHGPYSAFTRWRNEVARAAGYAVRPVTYDSGITHNTVDIDWDAIEHANPNVYSGEWTEPPVDPLLVLIAHSDCDGQIAPSDAARLADRLAELMGKLPNESQQTTQRFIAGLRQAVSSGEPVEFR